MKALAFLFVLMLTSTAMGQDSRLSASVQQAFEQAALSASPRELADFAAEIAPLDDVYLFGRPALIYAARHFEPDRLEIIAKSYTSASLDITDETGTSAVMHALMAGRIENARLLAARGASLAGANDRGDTVRVLAEEAGMPDFGPEILASLPIPTPAPEDINRVLLMAAEAGDTELVDWALALGADLVTSADNGLQAAHLAALGGHEDTFDHILTLAATPYRWDNLPAGDDKDQQRLTLVDVIIAGEGGGDHQRAGRMLMRALRLPDISREVDRQRARYRAAMMTIGYPLDVIVPIVGAPDLPAWDLGLPLTLSDDGGNRNDWQTLQRVLADKGLYAAEIDGIPGRGTLRGVIVHAVRALPSLIERVGVVQQLGAFSDPRSGVHWQQLPHDENRWQLAQTGLHNGKPTQRGYALALPPGMAPRNDLAFVPLGQRYSVQNLDGAGFTAWPIEFTYGGPGLAHIAYLRMSVFGRQLDVLFYEDRFTYQLQSVTRMYTSTERFPWMAQQQGSGGLRAPDAASTND